MKKNWLIALILFLVIILLGVLVDPTRTIIGRISQERFFRGRPTSYWRNALGNDDPVVKEAALQTLKQGGVETVAVLTELLERDRSPDAAEVRWTAAELLGELGPDARTTAPVLIASLQDPDPHVQSVAARSLAAVDAPPNEAIPALIEMLDTDQKIPAARALSVYGEQAALAIPKLVAVLTNRDLDAETRWNAARTLGKIRAPAAQAIPVLVECLRDQEPTVREHAAEALGDLGPAAQETASALIAVLTDPATKVRRDAARSLGQIGADRKIALSPLKNLLNDPEKIVRDASRVAIQAIAPEEELPPESAAHRAGDETKSAPKLKDTPR